MSAAGPPDFATLVDWLDGRLAPPDAERVADAVADSDATTQKTVQWLRGVIGTARSVPMHEPPLLVRQQLRQHFDRWSQARAMLSRAPREFVATLLFDSRKDLAPAGVRAGGDLDDEEIIHLAFTSEAGDLLVDAVRSGGGRFRIDGQVLPGDTGATVFEAMVTAPAFSARAVDGDELGRFSVTGIPADVVRIQVTNGEIVIDATMDLR